MIWRLRPPPPRESADEFTQDACCPDPGTAGSRPHEASAYEVIIRLMFWAGC